MTVVKEDRLACVERVSRRVTELVRKQKKWEIEGWTRRGVGGGGGGNACLQTHDSGKRPLIFHGLIHL